MAAAGKHHVCKISHPQKRWFMFSLTGGSWVLYHYIKSYIQDVKGEKRRKEREDRARAEGGE